MTLEGRGLIADFNPGDGSLTVAHSHQSPFQMQRVFSHHLNIPEHLVRVTSPDVGGGFGPKGGPYPEDALVLWASRRIGRPVKWLQTRGECLLGDNHARDQVIRGELALDAEGRFLAVRVTGYANAGAYLSYIGPMPQTSPIFVAIASPNARRTSSFCG